MRNLFLNWFITFFVAIIVQVYAINIIAIDNISPDIVLIALIYYCLTKGQINGMVLAFITGLLIDILSVGVIGATSFSKVFSIFLCGFLYNENKVDIILNNYNFLFIVFWVSFIDSVIYSLLTLKVDILSFSVLLFHYGLFPSLYTTLLSVLIYLKSPKKLFGYAG